MEKMVGSEGEEGFVESFTQIAWKAYLVEHILDFHGQPILYSEYLTNSYRKFVSIIKTLISPYSLSGEDKTIFDDYILGDKSYALKKINYPCSTKKREEHLEFTPELLEQLLNTQNNLDFFDESYGDNNVIIHYFRKIHSLPQEQQTHYLNLFQRVLSISERNPSLIINSSDQFDEIFEGKKIYEISPNDIEMIFSIKDAFQYDFINDYIKTKNDELDESEKIENSPRILEHLLTFVFKTERYYSTFVDTNSIKDVLNLVKERKIETPQDLEKEIELCNYLLKNNEYIATFIEKPDGLDGLAHFSLNRIKIALSNQEIMEYFNGRYSSNDFKGAESLLKLLKSAGIYVKEDELITNVCNSLEEKRKHRWRFSWYFWSFSFTTTTKGDGKSW